MKNDSSSWKSLRTAFRLSYCVTIFHESFSQSFGIVDSLVLVSLSRALRLLVDFTGFFHQHHSRHHHYFVYRYEKDNIAFIHSDLQTRTRHTLVGRSWKGKSELNYKFSSQFLRVKLCYTAYCEAMEKLSFG